VSQGFQRLQYLKQRGFWTLCVIPPVVVLTLFKEPVKHLDDGIALQKAQFRGNFAIGGEVARMQANALRQEVKEANLLLRRESCDLIAHGHVGSFW
jgi:hypothetical protein